MQILYLVLLIGVTLFLAIYCWSMAFHSLSSLRKKRAPFVPSSRTMIEHLPDLVRLDATSVVYDLGCGDGRVLRSLHRRFPSARYIGIENDLFPYLLARILSRGLPRQRFTIKRKNFFDEQTASATHIITYLFPEVMDQLLPKLEQELKPGTTLISFDFGFTHKQPDRIITTPKLKGHRILVYTF